MLFPMLDTTLNLILIAGTVVWAGLFIGGFAFNPLSDDRTQRVPVTSKMLMSALLVGAALVWWLGGTTGTQLAVLGLFIWLGMLVGFVGDLFIAELLPVGRSEIFGIALFLIGHFFYIVGCAHLARTASLTNITLLVAILAIFEVAGGALWLLLIRAPQAGRTLNVGSLVYTLGLCVMVSVAVWLAVQETMLLPLAVGAMLFLISDALVGMRLLRGTSFPLIRDVAWIQYSSGQLLIVFSVGSALRLL